MKNSVEIICIGTEILLGNIVNTNSAELSRGLAELGLDLFHHTVVGDNPKRLKEALKIAYSRADIVITTGGLGPTYDDLSKETIANFFGKKLVRDEKSEKWMEDFFTKIGRVMTENNKKQAMMPEGCIVIENKNGTAPGAIIEVDGKTAIMLPGPPREMRPMFCEQVMPYLAQRSEKTFHSHCLYFFGIGESQLEFELREEMESMKNPTLAPYAKEGEVMLRVTSAATDEAECERLMQPVIEKLLSRYPDLIYGVDVENLQTAAVMALRKAGLKVATAESCTGGLIAKRITDVSGASEVFECGVVSYANNIKEKLIGVSHETLSKYGAVSEQTACEMANGIRDISGADIGISVTGIAGPGGSEEKPVGLVYIGINCDWCDEVKEFHLSRGYAEDRDLIRLLASSNALSMLLKVIEQKKHK